MRWPGSTARTPPGSGPRPRSPCSDRPCAGPASTAWWPAARPRGGLVDAARRPAGPATDRPRLDALSTISRYTGTGWPRRSGRSRCWRCCGPGWSGAIPAGSGGPGRAAARKPPRRRPGRGLRVRLVPRKGQDALIRALPEIRRRVPGTRLLLVGGGPDERRLRRRWRPAPGSTWTAVLHVGRVPAGICPGVHAVSSRVRPAPPDARRGTGRGRPGSSRPWRRRPAGCRWSSATPVVPRRRCATGRPGTSSTAATCARWPPPWVPCSPIPETGRARLGGGGPAMGFAGTGPGWPGWPNCRAC